MCEKNSVTEKLEKELLYKPYECRIICTCIVSIVAFFGGQCRVRGDK